MKSKHKGAVAFETIILTPLMFLAFLLLLLVLFMGLSYVNFNSIASAMADDLNMRQTGYTDAMTNCTYLDSVKVGVSSRKDDMFHQTNGYLNNNQISVTPYSNELFAGTVCATNNYKNRFLLPFVTIDDIDVKASRPVLAADAEKMAGNTIVVSINYKFLGIQFQSVGYSTIT